jgi:glycosyltransferase involved in cell wall biosynthesis
MISTSSPRSARKPVVSVIMANYNGAAYLSDAIGSVLKQSLCDLELIVSDDASTDDSVRIVTEAMANDPRIRLIRCHRNRGPAAARNKALAVAEGDWIAIMDSDDLMHPDRLVELVEAAKRDHADIVADGLIEFANEPPKDCQQLTDRKAIWLSAGAYVHANLFYKGDQLGYLKPLFKSTTLTSPAFRYNESLRIGEDFDLMLRLLHFDYRFRVYSVRHYYYRKHATSISHRLNVAALIALKVANSKVLNELNAHDRFLKSSLKARARSIETALAYERLLVTLKARDFAMAFCIAVTRPRAALLLRLPIGVRIGRLLAFLASPRSKGLA